MFRSASSSTNPRSILKHHSASYHNHHPTELPPPSPSPSSRHCAVRFPSSPKISTIHFTHCSTSYDRRPIVVLPNSCALPDRGCRDYSYDQQSPFQLQQQQQQLWANHVHPSVFARFNDGERHSGGSSSSPSSEEFDWCSGGVPALTHDDASSEESDGIASPPPEHPQHNKPHYYTPPSQSHLHSEPLSHPPIPDCYNNTIAGNDFELAFLPHAPTTTSTTKKHKKRTSLEGHDKRSSTTTGTGFGWASSCSAAEESSCLEGF